MLIELPQNAATNVHQNLSRLNVPRVTAVFMLFGFLVGAAAVAVSQAPLLGGLGIWLLSLGGALIASAFVSHYRYGESIWGWALAGQFVGVLGVALLFAASLFG